MENTERPLLTTEEIERIMEIRRETISMKDAAVMFVQCAEKLPKSLNRAEIIFATARMAYLLGFRDGIEAINECFEQK